MRFILGKKLGMTQLFGPDGRVFPVTSIDTSLNTVVQVKTDDKDNYKAIQVGFDKKKDKNQKKSEKGHLKGLDSFRHLREFRVDDVSKYKRGDVIKADIFSVGEKVKVSGKNIGRGFQGVVKRHGFSGGPASHGHRHALRSPGSIGSAYPQRVFKGKKMAGQMGAKRVSIKNLEIIRIDNEKNLIFVKGSLPGKKGSVVEIRSLNSTERKD